MVYFLFVCGETFKRKINLSNHCLSISFIPYLHMAFVKCQNTKNNLYIFLYNLN